MPHGNKTGMDYTVQLSTKNYELRELHEDRGDRMNNDLNVLRQNDIMTGRDLKVSWCTRNEEECCGRTMATALDAGAKVKFDDDTYNVNF